MAKYINPFTDEGFKRLFGQEEHKTLLIAFLNRLFEGEMVVTDLTYRDKETLPHHDKGKSYRFDVYCTLSTGEHIIVEMQNKQQDYFLQRSIVYGSRCIDHQTVRGKEWNYDQLNAVFTISFLNYTQVGLPETLVVDGQIRDKYTGEIINPYLRLIYIQLPRLTKPLEQCTTPIEQWIYVLKNITNMVQIPPRLKESLEELQYFEDVMNEASMTCEERERYERSLDVYRQEMNSMSFYTRKGREEGLEEGIQIGRAEGINEGVLMVARSMKDKGMDTTTIAELTSLTADVIEGL